MLRLSDLNELEAEAVSKYMPAQMDRAFFGMTTGTTIGTTAGGAIGGAVGALLGPIGVPTGVVIGIGIGAPIGCLLGRAVGTAFDLAARRALKKEAKKIIHINLLDKIIFDESNNRLKKIDRLTTRFVQHHGTNELLSGLETIKSSLEKLAEDHILSQIEAELIQISISYGIATACGDTNKIKTTQIQLKNLILLLKEEVARDIEEEKNQPPSVTTTQDLFEILRKPDNELSTNDSYTIDSLVTLYKTKSLVWIENFANEPGEIQSEEHRHQEDKGGNDFDKKQGIKHPSHFSYLFQPTPSSKQDMSIEAEDIDLEVGMKKPA